MAGRFVITLAGVNVEMVHTYDRVRRECEDYLAAPGALPTITATTSPEKIAAERTTLGTPVAAEYAESLCLFRDIAEQMPLLGRAVFHGAAIDYRGAGLLFTAPSGTGKSTHIALWRQVLGDEVRIVNGDKPLLWLREDGVEVCSTPWAGKENWQRNTTAPLRALCLLERGSEDVMRRVEPSEVLDRLLAQVYLPYDPVAAAKTLEIMDGVVTRVPVYRLSCTPTPRAATVAFEALKSLF